MASVQKPAKAAAAVGVPELRSRSHAGGGRAVRGLTCCPGNARDRLGDEEKEFAVVAAVPVTAAGLTYIYGRQCCPGVCGE